jgi:hypothetical protein
VGSDGSRTRLFTLYEQESLLIEDQARMNDTGIRSRAKDASDHPNHFTRASGGGQHRESGENMKEEKTLG